MAQDFIQSGIVKQKKTVNFDDFVFNRHCSSVKKDELFTEMQRQYLDNLRSG